MSTPTIDSPEAKYLTELCNKLSAASTDLEAKGDLAWPAEQLRLMGEYGVFGWFLPKQVGGAEWSANQLVDGYLALSGACLTTTFVLTQRVGACRRIANSDNSYPREQIMDKLISGECFATVGISHLTTSHRHVAKPILTGTENDSGFTLNGFCPWVTGAPHADYVVVGATLEDGRQILLCVPMNLDGISIPDTEKLLALTASQTGKINFNSTHVESCWLLAGPAENVMAQGVGAATGGIQTSTLALGLAQSAIRFLGHEASARETLSPIESALKAEWEAALAHLRRYAQGEPDCTTEELRAQSNSLTLRATQAAMAAAKGRGFVRGHEAGRWCREALFFLVWSCPQPVVQAQLCELAGISGGIDE